MKPIKPLDDRPADTSRDHAGAGGFSMYALERMLADCVGQPAWRSRADIANAYYDGKQLTPQQQQQCIIEGLEARAPNLIRPVINSVLGQEAKTRADITITADDDEMQDVAEVIGAKLKEAERETNAHMGVSNGYASQVKGGIGWVHVARNADPLDYPYLVEDVHRNEIWWDWHGQRGFAMDRARWLVRKRMIDLDEITAALPQHAAVLERSVNGWDSLLDNGAFLGEPGTTLVSSGLISAYDAERRFRVARTEWVDTARKMIKLYEVWYRVPAQVVMMRISPTRSVQFNPANVRHQEAVSRGMAQLFKATTSQVRMALFAGPHRLVDQGTSRRHFPYVPFFCFRDDEDHSPYGLIDGMICPQDEFNERRLRIQWMLKAKQVMIDDDVASGDYNTIAEIAESVMRPDMVAVLNANRKNTSGGLTIRNDLEMQPEQFTVMADSKQLIQDTAGRYASQLGQAQVQSGVANSILVEQGEQAMGEMNDNYHFARKRVFELLVDEIVQDHKTENIKMPVGTGRTRRVVVLNTFDPQTQQPVNMVEDAVIKTGTGEVPSSPAYRQQQQKLLATIITALGNNPKATAILAPAFIESTDLPARQQIADDLRKAEGLPVAGDKEGAARAEQQQQVAAAAQAQAAQAAAVANVATLQSKARLTAAQASEIEQRNQAQTDIAESHARTAASIASAQLNQAKAAEIDAAASNPVDQDQLIKDALAEAMA